MQGLPCLRFNKEGNLLVVTTADNGFKILANADGIRTLRAIQARSYEASRAPTEMKVIIFHSQHHPPPQKKKKIAWSIFGQNLVCCMFMDQVFRSAMVGNINPVIAKVECIDRSSPARPTPILVCYINDLHQRLGFSSEILISDNNDWMTIDWLEWAQNIQRSFFYRGRDAIWSKDQIYSHCLLVKWCDSHSWMLPV